MQLVEGEKRVGMAVVAKALSRGGCLGGVGW